jgi:hypothetical protein
LKRLVSSVFNAVSFHRFCNDPVALSRCSRNVKNPARCAVFVFIFSFLSRAFVLGGMGFKRGFAEEAPFIGVWVATHRCQ